MLAVGNDEIERAPVIGQTVLCWICGDRHDVQYGEKVLSDGTRIPSKLLAFFKCGDKAYLCGINGKEIRPSAKRRV